MCMEISSIKPKTICITLTASIGGLDTLPKWIRDKLIALGISVPQNVTEEQALFLIKQKEEEIKEKKKIELQKHVASENDDIKEQKLLNSLDFISQNNKVALELYKQKASNKKI